MASGGNMTLKRTVLIAALALAGCVHMDEDLLERRLDGSGFDLPGTASAVDTEEGRNRVYQPRR